MPTMCLLTSIFKRTQDFSRSAKAFVLYMIVFFQIMAERLRPLAEQFKRGRHTHTYTHTQERERVRDRDRNREKESVCMVLGCWILLGINYAAAKSSDH